MNRLVQTFKSRLINLKIYFLFMSTQLSRAGCLGALVMFVMFSFALMSVCILPYLGVPLPADLFDEDKTTSNMDASVLLVLPMIWLIGTLLWGKIKFGNRTNALVALLHRRDPRSTAYWMKNWDRGQYSPGAFLWFLAVIGWAIILLVPLGLFGLLVGLD